MVEFPMEVGGEKSKQTLLNLLQRKESGKKGNREEMEKYS
jgi:hypothetical protein